MPDWKKSGPDLDAADSELDKIAMELSRTVSTQNPSMEDVIGVSPEDLSNHAGKSVAAYLAYPDNAYSGPLSLIHLYTMGFVVGVRWQQSREKKNDGKSEEGTGST